MVVSCAGDSGGVSGKSCGSEGGCEACMEWDCPFSDIGVKGRVGIYVVDGGRYVIPMALCTPDTSTLAGMKEMVASPGLPPGTIGGIQNLMIESGFLGENSRNEWTLEGSKNLKPRIFLAAAGSANIVVIGDVGSNWRKVAS